MNSFPMPSRPPYDDCDFYFDSQHVSLVVPTSVFYEISEIDWYIIHAAALVVSDEEHGLTLYTFTRSGWDEVVRLLAMATEAPEAAIYAAWLNYDPSPNVPGVFKAMKGGVN